MTIINRRNGKGRKEEEEEKEQEKTKSGVNDELYSLRFCYIV